MQLEVFLLYFHLLGSTFCFFDICMNTKIPSFYTLSFVLKGGKCMLHVYIVLLESLATSIFVGKILAILW